MGSVGVGLAAQAGVVGGQVQQQNYGWLVLGLEIPSKIGNVATGKTTMVAREMSSLVENVATGKPSLAGTF